MTGYDAPRAREEAERLVASVLAAATFAARGFGGASGARAFGGAPAAAAARAMGVPPELAGVVGRLFGPTMATGSPECCACPICRTIAALRDPDPDVAERLATGAGDIAAGVANLLRAFSAGRESTSPHQADHAPGAEPGDAADAGGSAPREAADTADSAPGDAADTAPGAPGDAAPGGQHAARPPTPPWSRERDAHDDPWHAATTGDVPPDS